MTDEPPVVHLLEACAEPECLERVHRLLDQLWGDVPDLDPGRRMGFEIAVAEVAANIVEHGRDPEETRHVDLHLRLVAYDDRVEAHFRDTGRVALVDLTRPALPGDESEDGRGLAIAGAAVDEVAYERHGEVNLWRMVQHRG